MNAQGFVVHPDVQAALSKGEPVVALESTIISHGKTCVRVMASFMHASSHSFAVRIEQPSLRRRYHRNAIST